jgi:exonuclease III
MLLRQNVESNPGMGKEIRPTLSIMTYNCNGLGDKTKLKRVLTKLSPIVEKGGIVLLQETHIVDTKYLKLFWKNKFESNCCKTNAAGVIILYRNDITILDSFRDEEGRHLTIVLNQDSRTLIVTNVYFPNDQRKSLKFAEQVYLKILEVQQTYPDNLTFLAGDFNTCMSEKDYMNRNNSIIEKHLAEMISSNNNLLKLTDAYRTVHKEKGYTWRRGTCYSRLDYIFLPYQLKSKIINATVDWSFEASDHASVKIDLALGEVPTKGPGIAKTNTNILEDPQIVLQIRNELIELLNQVEESWNPHSKLEFLKVAIRSVFSSKTAEIRKIVNTDILDTEDELNQLEEIRIKELSNTTISSHHTAKMNNIDTAIASLKLNLTKQRSKLSDTQSFKSKAKWFEYGEKSNKFFLNLMKSRQNQKLITKIRNGDKVYEGQEEVGKGITKFYSELYEDKVRNFDNNDSFYSNCPKLTKEQAQNLEKELTLENLHEAVRTCKDSSPGPDGIPYTVYKKFWDITGPIILESWKYSVETGKLPPSHNESIITLLPKEGKDMEDIKNWRPITLSNCDAKIITKALTFKISKILNSIIDESQTAYVPGRSVADNLRSNYFLKSYCKQKDIDSVLISLDAKKAFDSVDHRYIEETLRAYGFGEGFIGVFRTLYKDITARVMVNGFVGEAIRIRRGVKQGDSLSCAIFIICIDPLIRNLNNADIIRNIKYNSNGHTTKVRGFKAGAYADDISVICKSDTMSIQSVFDEYNKLTRRSGLELNADKTEILKLNSGNASTVTFNYNGHEVKIKTVNSIKICGLHYCWNMDTEYKLNVIDKIEKLKNKIRIWTPRHLTMEGKSLIIKTFGLSQLIYNMQSYEFKLSELQNVETIIFKFIWSNSEAQNGVDRIKRSVLKNDYESGGMKITDVECLDRSLKLKQFIRASKAQHAIAEIQNIITGSDGNLKQEYSKITEREVVAKSAQETLNIIIDYNRDNYEKLRQEEYESDKNLIDEVASINLRAYLERKQRMFARCVLKRLTDNGITTLGELITAYEFEEDTNLNKAMKIIINSFPKHLINIAKCYNEEINSDIGELKYMLIGSQSRIAVEIITTKELQICLKKSLKRVEVATFNDRLGIVDFKADNIIKFRKMCQNSKLRNIYFRLIHNDFFTYERMKRYNMTNTNRCIRCGEVETTKHLLWECQQVRNIWLLFNNLMVNLNKQVDLVSSYDEVYNAASSSGTNLIKIRLIQELIQIDRPKNWGPEHIKRIITNLINTDKYNAIKSFSLAQHAIKWGFLTTSQHT